MLNTAEKMIETVDYFGCGYCTSDLKKIFKGFDKTITDFYAGVFLIKHRKMGYILYDTGYSMDILKNKVKISLNSIGSSFVILYIPPRYSLFSNASRKA